MILPIRLFAKIWHQPVKNCPAKPWSFLGVPAGHFYFDAREQPLWTQFKSAVHFLKLYPLLVLSGSQVPWEEHGLESLTWSWILAVSLSSCVSLHELLCLVYLICRMALVGIHQMEAAAVFSLTFLAHLLFCSLPFCNGWFLLPWCNLLSLFERLKKKKLSLCLPLAVHFTRGTYFFLFPLIIYLHLLGFYLPFYVNLNVPFSQLNKGKGFRNRQHVITVDESEFFKVDTRKLPFHTLVWVLGLVIWLYI